MSLPVIQKGILAGAAAPSVIVTPVGIQAWPNDPGGAELGPFAVPAGAMLVAFLSWSGGANLISFTWNGLPLVLRKEIYTPVNIFLRTGIWTLNVAAGATALLTSFMDNQIDGIISAAIVSGVAASADVSAGTSGSSTTPDSGLTALTAQAQEVVFGVITTEGAASDDPGAWQDGLTAMHRLDVSGFDDHTQATGYKIVNATGQYRAAKTGITSRPWHAIASTVRA